MRIVCDAAQPILARPSFCQRFLFLFFFVLYNVAADTLNEGRRPSLLTLTKDVDVDGTKTRLNNRIPSSGNTIMAISDAGKYKTSSNANVFDDGTEHLFFHSHSL